VYKNADMWNQELMKKEYWNPTEALARQSLEKMQSEKL